MPITPRFHLSQTDSHITIDIHVPHVRVNAQSVEVLVEDTKVHFSSPPYLLVLNFPFPFHDDCNNDDDTNTTGSTSTAKYDPIREGGMITMVLEKKESPHIWPDLDLMGNLMMPSMKACASSSSSSTQRQQRRRRAGPLQATIVSEQRSLSLEEDENENENENNEEFTSSSSRRDTTTTTTTTATATIDLLMNIGRPQYGFANMYVGVYTDLVRDGMAMEMLQLANPDETPEDERRTLRLEYENKAFDPDRYLQDMDITDDYIYECAMKMELYWKNIHDDNDTTTTDTTTTMDELSRNLANLSTAVETNTTSYFTEAEAMQLASISYPILPNDLNNNNKKEQLLLGLLDILYAFVYDHLVTQGDSTVESSWNTCTLSSTFSWLDSMSFDDVSSVVQSSIRRTLIFPYMRNYNFALYCWTQVAMILKHGRRCVIRSLLLIRTILEQSEFHYLGNKLYVDPYLSWLQRSIHDDDMVQLASQLDDVLHSRNNNGEQVSKSSLGLNLVELEEEFLGYSEENDDDDDDDHDDEEADSNNNNNDNDAESSSSETEVLPKEIPRKKVLIEELS